MSDDAGRPHRVLVVHNSYQQRGGEDGCFEADVALLRAHGHEVETYHRSNNEVATRGRFRTAIDTAWSRTTYRDAARRIAAFQPDLVHVHNTFPLVSPSVFAAARRAGVPVLATMHNYRLACVNGCLYRDGAVCTDCLGKGWAWRGIVHRCYRNSACGSAVVAGAYAVHRLRGDWRTGADGYIVLSPFARTALQTAGLSADRVHLRENYLLEDPGMGTAREPYALFVGRLTDEKGVPLLLDAWARAQTAGLRLRIAGDGPLADRVRSAAARDDVIDVLGPLAGDEVIAQMQRASFLVFPSTWYEGMPRVLIESLACGTPVVANALGSVPDMIVPTTHGRLTEETSVDSFASALSAMASEPDAVEAMRGACRRTFEERYTAERGYQRLMEIAATIRTGITPR